MLILQTMELYWHKNMATRQFSDLSQYRRNVDNAQKSVNVLDSLIQGAQQGLQLQRLPQSLQDQNLAQQLQNAINLQKLQDLQNPERALARRIEQELTVKAALNPNSGIVRADPSLVGETIAQPGALTQEQQASLTPQSGVTNPLPSAPAVGASETPISAFGIQTGLNINPAIPEQAEEDKLDRQIQLANARKKGATIPTLQFRTVGNTLIGVDPISGEEKTRIALDPKKQVRQTKQGLFEYDPANPSEGRIIPGTQPPEKDLGLTPSQRISAKREIRSTYDELPAKLDYFGKGQVPGSNQLKTRLDAILKPVNSDYSKLNPQAKQTFVFAINKLRDPTSATLLAEAEQIASKSGLGDRFRAWVSGYKEGDPLPDQVAKDIYTVISQVADTHRENLINSLIPIIDDADSIDVKLTSLGVPKDIQDEAEKRRNSIDLSEVNAPTAPSITSQQEYDALPSGSLYMEDGVQYRKP